MFQFFLFKKRGEKNFYKNFKTNNLYHYIKKGITTQKSLLPQLRQDF